MNFRAFHICFVNTKRLKSFHKQSFLSLEIYTFQYLFLFLKITVSKFPNIFGFSLPLGP